MKNNKIMTAFELLKKLAQMVWHSVSRNYWYKLLSVVIAVFLWSYVITSNPSITLYKTLDVDIVVSGQSVFDNRNLSLITDLANDPIVAKVRVSVPQANYSSLSDDNVNVYVDLSSVRKTGQQPVKLRGTTVYGSIVSISPETVELEVDNLDQRNVPVNAILTGIKDDENYWYNIAKTNPSVISLSGPASIVQRASTAEIQLDVTGRTESYSSVEAPVILDTQGNPIEGAFTKSASTIAVTIDIYPKKKLPVTTSIDEVLTGELPRGFQIDGDIEVQPQTIIVAADQALLDTLTSVLVTQIDVSNSTRSFNRNTSVNKLKDVKNYSSETVNVKVDIIEDDQSRPFTNVTISLVNLADGYKTKWSNPRLTVTATGAYTVIERLTRQDLEATIDLSGITEPGTYELPILVKVASNPELSFSIEPKVATVTISKG